MNGAVFLDRDGVLNLTHVRDRKPYAPTRVSQFRLLPGVTDAVHRLRQHGYLTIVVTNQPDVGNGRVARETVEHMHGILRDLVPVDEVFACYHRQSDGCDCRKPQPGMLLRAAERFEIDFRRSYMVGDRASDIAAGEAVGCTTAFIDAHYAEAPPSNPRWVVSSLPEAVDRILTGESNSPRR